MDATLGALSRAIEGNPAIAVASAFAWGVLSVVLSPCHLATIPLIVAFVVRQGRNAGALRISTAIAVGVLLTIGIIGAATATAGRVMGDVGPVGSYVVAGVFLVVGLHLIGVIPLPQPALRGLESSKGRSGSALGLGLMLGLVLGPCTFAFMAPVLGATLRLASTRLTFSLVLLLAYALGHASVILSAGLTAATVQRYLDWDARSAGTRIARAICGVLVIAGGIYLVYRA